MNNTVQIPKYESLIKPQAWLLNMDFFNQYAMLVRHRIAQGKDLSNLVESIDSEAYLSAALGKKINYDRDSSLYYSKASNQKRVAIIPIQGTLTKRGDLCSYGMRDYGAMIERANESENIDSILLDMETPGGTVDGTAELGLVIKNSEKPVLAYGDTMVASAGIWLASQAAEIWGNKNNPTEFGSIGVLYAHQNWSAYIQNNIGSITIFRAPQSVDKAKINSVEELTPELEKEIGEELRVIADQFIQTVKIGRGDRLSTGNENIFSGKMYPSKKAKKMGLIDFQGTFQNAVDRAGLLAKRQSRNSNANIQSNNKMGLLDKWLSSADAGADGEETVAVPTAELSQLKADLQSAQGKLKAAEDEKVQLANELKNEKALKEAAEQKVESLEHSVSEKDARIQELEKEPAAVATTAVASEDPDSQEQENKYETSADKRLAEARKKINLN
ncbi:MAG: S49 family peptidase [Bacteroidota bacterium]